MYKIIQYSAPAQDFESITVSNTAVGLTPAKIASKEGCFISVEDQTIRYRYDGADPTASVGHILYPASRMNLMHPTILGDVKFIRAESSDATLRVTYF